MRHPGKQQGELGEPIINPDDRIPLPENGKEHKQYRRLVGQTLWLSSVRRDIAFDGQSFAVFPQDKFNWDNTLSDDFDAGEITIEIKLSTHAADGLILFQGSFSKNFIALGGKTNLIAMVI